MSVTLCDALDVKHNQRGVEEWLNSDKFSIPKTLKANGDMLFLHNNEND